MESWTSRVGENARYQEVSSLEKGKEATASQKIVQN